MWELLESGNLVWRKALIQNNPSTNRAAQGNELPWRGSGTGRSFKSLGPCLNCSLPWPELGRSDVEGSI